MRLTDESVALYALIGFAAWLLIALPIMYYPGSSCQYQAEHSQQTAKYEQASIAQKAENSHQNKPDECGGEFWSAKLTDWLLAVFTLALVVVTYLLWNSTNKLWKSGEAQLVHFEKTAVRQSKETEKSLALAKRAADAANASAIATRESLYVAQQTLRNASRATEVELRAYISVTGAKITNCKSVPVIDITFKNCGLTPASNVVCKIKTVVFAGELVEEPDLENGCRTDVLGHVGPNIDILSNGMAFELIDDNVISSLNSGDTFMYQYGIISYNDIFGENRVLKFCFFMGNRYENGNLSVYRLWNDGD